VRRLLALFGACVVGSAAAVAFVAPAVAHSGTTTQTSDCVTAAEARYGYEFDGPAGTATIALADRGAGKNQLCADEKQDFSLVSYITNSSGFSVPQTVFAHRTKTITAKSPRIELKVAVPSCYTQVDLVFGSEVINPMTDKGDRYGNRKLGSNDAPGNRAKGNGPGWFNGGKQQCLDATAAFAPSCDGTVVVNLATGDKATVAGTFTVTGSHKFSKTVTVKPGDKVGQVTVPAASADAIEVALPLKAKPVKYAWTAPAGCGEADVTSTSDCSSLTVSVKNPEGSRPLTATVTSGSQSKTITVAAGATGTVTFAATGTTTAVVKSGDKVLGEASYAKPASCGEATPQLPVTGANVALMAGGAVVLLGIGGGLYLTARRKRISFTA
jgi:LPXTG-motif cell wall-anchored protein